jgi:predicted Zn-dependent peptidase
MKKITLFIFLFAFLVVCQSLFAQEDFRKTAPKPGPAPKIELGKTEELTLKNGMRVILVENHKLPSISFELFVDVPDMLEGEFTGTADLAGALLNKGTASRTKSQLDEEIDFLGASLSSSANGISGSCLSKYKEKLLELMADVLLNPSFPEVEFEKIKKQTLANLAQEKEDANSVASNVAKVLRFGKNHPYGEIETEKTIASINVDQCKSYYNKYFKPNISYLLVTGDIKKDELATLAPKYFGTWQRGEVSKEKFPSPQRPESTQVSFVDKAGAVQSVINITYSVDLKPGAPDAIKTSVLNTLLGGAGYFGSRLNSNLREDKAYTYGARSILSPDLLAGTFSAYASVRNEVTDSAVVQFLLELNRLRTEPVNADELEMTKNFMTGGFARSLEDPGTLARFALNTKRYNLPPDYYQTYLEKLSKVSAQDLMEVANKYVTPENAHILVVGNKDEVMSKLAVFTADSKVNQLDAFGNPVESAGLAIPSGVSAESVISDYVDALGGADKLKKIKSFKMVMTTSVQGMNIETILTHQSPGKLLMVNTMMGNEMQKMIFDGEKGVQIQMGQAVPMSEEQVADYKIDARLIPERFYKELGVQTELKGIEMIEGKKAYKLSIVYPSGSKKTHYFDQETSLKIREVEMENGVTVTNDIGDYREVNGVKFPHVVTIHGAVPFPLKMETKSIELDGTFDEKLFQW